MYVCKLYWNLRLIYNFFCSFIEIKCSDIEWYFFDVYFAVRG